MIKFYQSLATKVSRRCPLLLFNQLQKEINQKRFIVTSLQQANPSFLFIVLKLSHKFLRRESCRREASTTLPEPIDDRAFCGLNPISPKTTNLGTGVEQDRILGVPFLLLIGVLFCFGKMYLLPGILFLAQLGSFVALQLLLYTDLRHRFSYRYWQKKWH